MRELNLEKTLALEAPKLVPPVPVTFEETGLEFGFLADLALNRVRRRQLYDGADIGEAQALDADCR
jgi:hypothetical protein